MPMRRDNVCGGHGRNACVKIHTACNCPVSILINMRALRRRMEKCVILIYLFGLGYVTVQVKLLVSYRLL